MTKELRNTAPGAGVMNLKALRGSKRLFGCLLLFLLWTGADLHAQVSTRIDTTSIRIGEQIQYEIIVDQTEGVRFPKFELDSLNRVGVVSSKVDSLKNQLVKKYVLTSFDSGSYRIPGQEVYIRDKSFFTDPVIIDVATVPVDTLQQPMHHIKDIRNEPYLFSDYLNYFWGLLLALLVIGIILYFVLRDKPEHEEVVELVPPFDLAKQRLKELDEKKLLEQNRIKLYYVELTDIIRTFIEREMNIPALESTSGELLETIRDFNSSSKLEIPEETLDKLNRLLREADLVKFAKSKPLSNEIALHRTDAEKIIDMMHPAQEKRKKTLNEELVTEHDQ